METNDRTRWFTPPRSVRAKAFALTLVVLVSPPSAGCGDPCAEPGRCELEVTPTPVPGEPVYGVSFLADPPLTWALKREVLQEVFVPGQFGLTEDAWYPQVTRTYYLVVWEPQPDGSYVQRERTCSMDTSEVYVVMPNTVKAQVTVIPDRLIEHLPVDAWTFVLESAAPEDFDHTTAVYALQESEFGPQYSIWGADIQNPVQEICPPDAKADGWVDQDEDGYPGVTTEMWIDGEFYAKTLVCQRWLHRSYPAMVTFLEDGVYRISGGMYDIVVDQSQYGTLEEPSPKLIEGQDPEVRWYPNDQTYYIMTSLPDGATCDDVTPDLFL